MYNFNTLNILTDLKRTERNNIICTMNDVRGDFLGQPHGTMPAAVKITAETPKTGFLASRLI